MDSTELERRLRELHPIDDCVPCATRGTCAEFAWMLRNARIGAEIERARCAREADDMLEQVTRCYRRVCNGE